jgi:phosphatidylglycerol---prolipoprotein diacylglyceryl transferase
VTVAAAEAAAIGFPRYFRIAGAWINSYKVLLCVGIDVGSLSSASLAPTIGAHPLSIGLGAALSALTGLVGARLYHLALRFPAYAARHSWRAWWDTRNGGWGVFGALITFVPATVVVARLSEVRVAVFWDVLSFGVLTGGFWIRCGCAFNGCCAGRPSASRFALRLHDTRGVSVRRVPVQLLEMAWWLLGTAIFLVVWPAPFAPGSYALGVLAWYGAGRTVLEPLRARPDLILGRVPVNQVVAGGIAAVSALVLVLIN